MASILEDKLRPNHIPIYYSYKRIKWEQLAVGIFGALAIFGVLMKLWQPPFWGLISPETGQLLFEIFMPIGFLGECIVFIIMGFVKGDDYIEVFPTNDERKQLQEVSSGPGVNVNLEISDSIRDLIEKKMDKQLDAKIKEIVDIVAGQASSTIELNKEVNRVQQNLLSMGNNVAEFSERVVDLKDNVGALNKLKDVDLSNKVQMLNESLNNASLSIKGLQGQIDKASRKFEHFNS